jgi:hypothetical protein
MNPEPSPYDAAIADVQARIEKLQITLETLRQLRGQADGSPALAGAPRNSEAEVQHDTFFGMTIGDAASKYLTMTKSTKSTAEISAALEMGGLKHSSKDFPTTVRSVLGHRSDFLRVPNGDWGLAEWYPGVARAKKLKAEPQPKVAAKAEKAKVDTTPIAHDTGLTRRERILQIMRTNPSKGWTAGEIAAANGDKRKLVQATLCQMDEVVKADTGGYRIADAA